MKESELTIRETGFIADPNSLLRLFYRWRMTAVTILFLPLFFGCSTSNLPVGESFVAPDSLTRVKGKYKPIQATYGPRGVQSSDNTGKRETGSYVLGPGDSMTVVIQRVPNGSYDVAVRPDGYISLPIVDEVKVAGLTPAELDDHLTKLFSQRFVNPDLSVVVRTLRQPVVYVLGKVAKPGPILFHEASSAAEAIARAGDMLPNADVKKVMVIRLDEDGIIRPMALHSENNNEVFRYQAGPYMALAATQLEPEDIIFVPENGMSRLGGNLEQLFRPVTAIGGAASSVLSPWLQWEVLEELRDNDSDTGISVPANRPE